MMNMRANYYWGPSKGPESTFARRAKWSGVHVPVCVGAPAGYPFWLKCLLPFVLGIVLLALPIADLATGGEAVGFMWLREASILWFGGLFAGGILSLLLPLHWIARRRRIRAVMGYDVDWS